MTVSNSWLVNVNVGINTAVVQVPTFNYCMLLGVMPTQTSPYHSPPDSWSGVPYKNYASLAAFQTDFAPLIAGATTAGDLEQLSRFIWLQNAVAAFFAQQPTPVILTVMQMLPPTSGTSYTTLLANLNTLYSTWYGFSICDLILPASYSTCIVTLTATTAGVIPAGTVVTPETATASYTLLYPYSVPGAGTYKLPFYSTDATTAISASTFTAISPVQSFISAVTNAAVALNGIPGMTTASTGVGAALSNLRSSANNNPKKCFLDTNDPTFAGTVQTAGGSEDLLLCFHSLNLQAPNATTGISISAACLSEYFTDLFNVGVGMKPFSSMQLSAGGSGSVVPDPYVTTANIGIPGTAGGSSNLIGWNNNVYAGIGAPPGIGLMQYGYMSNSQSGVQIYLDQVVGSDFIQLTAQADLVTFIIRQQPTGGVLYNDFGIQQIVSVFKGAVQKAVAQNIIQNPPNSAFVYSNYAQVPQQDIANRIYQDLFFNGEFLSRIQRIAVQVNLSL